jgi:hypothetical protein
MVILPTFAVARDLLDFASAQAPMVSRIDTGTGTLAIPERSVALSAAAAALCGQRRRSDAQGKTHRERNRGLDQHVNLLVLSLPNEKWQIIATLTLSATAL